MRDNGMAHTVHNAVIRVSVPIPDYQYCTWNLEDMGMTYTNYQYSTWVDCPAY